MIRLPKSVIDSLRLSAQGVVYAFEFSDGTIEAYGPDAYLLFDAENAQLTTSDDFDTGDTVLTYRRDRAEALTAIASVSLWIPVAVLNGDDLLREFSA